MKYKYYFAVLLLLLCATSLRASYTQVDGIWYDFDNNTKTASVTYRGKSFSDYSNEYTGEIIIPSSVTFNGITYNVSDIGSYAFYDCSDLTSVIIPNSVTNIGSGAFYSCTGLTSIEIPNSVTNIGGAFPYCTGLTSIEIPNSVTNIGGGAFSYCSALTSVTIGNNVANIGDKAFYYCSSLTSIELPNSVTNVGKEAFRECPNMKSLTIGKNVANIGEDAFYGCTGLTSIVWNAINCTTSGLNHLFGSCFDKVSSFVFGDEVEIIPRALCISMERLNSITIPGNVACIREYAFSGCSGLSSITIPNNVATIEDYAFANCRGLTNVCLPNSITRIEEGTFIRCTNLISLSFPESIISVGAEAFSGCTNINSVTIPKSIIEINENAFNGCNNIREIHFAGCNAEWCTKTWLPEDISSSYDLYLGTEKVVDFEIPNSITQIAKGSFYGCRSLNKIILGASLKILDEESFYGCSGVQSIICYSQRPPMVKNNALYGISDNVIIFTPANYLNNYIIHEFWGLYDVRPLSAVSVETNEVIVNVSNTKADVEWPAVDNAATYELVIKDKNGNVACTLIFNANGQLTQIAFSAPARDRSEEQTQSTGFSFTVTGLEEGTAYDLTITAKDSNGTIIQTTSQSFTTASATGLDNTSATLTPQKVLRNGKVLILRDGRTYDLQGQEVK